MQDRYGAILVNMVGNSPTYRVAISDLTAFAANATDVFTLTGNATRKIEITHFSISGDATSAGVIDFYLFKRSTLNTGGTFTSPTIAQMDSADPAPTATAVLYSVNPTVGTGVAVASNHYALPAAATTGYPGLPWEEPFGTEGGKPLVLRSANESFSFSLNAQAIPAGLNLYFHVEWTEVPY